MRQVGLACGKIVDVATGILEAHRFGVDEGIHERPWSAAFHLDALEVYAGALPDSHRQKILRLFEECVPTMTDYLIPAWLAEDWLIVLEYLRQAVNAMQGLRAESDVRGAEPEDWWLVPVDGPTPRVIRFDLLAQLTTTPGAQRLLEAAGAVTQHLQAQLQVTLDEQEVRLLVALAAGARVSELAEQLHYSERSIYRLMSVVWSKLGAADRRDGLRIAAARGLLD